MFRTATLMAAVLAAASLFAPDAQADGDRYIIVTGKGAGGVVVTSAPGGTTVLPADNPGSQASGTIAETTNMLGETVKVYHGTLGGKADPAPNGSGWGKVVKVPAGASIAGDFATAVQKVGSAAQIVASFQLGCNGQQALMDLDAAKAALQAMKAKIDTAVAAGALPAAMAAKHKKVLDELSGAVDEAKALVQDLIDHPLTSLADLATKAGPLKQKGKKMLKKLLSLLDHLRECGLIPLE